MSSLEQPRISARHATARRITVMRFFSISVLRTFLVLTILVAALIFGSHWMHALVIPVFPLILPGIFMFGEEWEPKFGVWGALFIGWLVSVPCTYLIAWLYRRVTFRAHGAS